MSGDPHSKRLHGRRPELQSPTHPKLCEAKVPVIPAALIRFRQPLHVLRRERACVGVTWHAEDHGRALGVLYWVYILIMEKNMVTTIIYGACILDLYWGFMQLRLRNGLLNPVLQTCFSTRLVVISMQAVPGSGLGASTWYSNLRWVGTPETDRLGSPMQRLNFSGSNPRRQLLLEHSPGSWSFH